MNFELDDTLQIDVTHITMPPPGSGLPKGKRKRYCFGTDNYGEFLQSKRSVIRIVNDDELCCARAIVVAKAIADEDERLKVIKDPRSNLQENLARALHDEARVPIGPCGLDQIKLFEIILNEYQFVIVSAEHGHAIVHKGPPSDKQIMLLIHDGHFDVITKLPGFFYSNYYCLECESRCRDYELFKHTEKPDLPCKDCGRHFYGVTCQLNHLTLKANDQLVAPLEKNVCKSHKKCSICLHVFTSTAQEHVKHCGLQYCPSCSKEVNILQHKCYLQPITHEKKTKRKNEKEQHPVFVYFDIEAQQDTGNDVANLVCAETDQNDTQFTFQGKDCIQQFLHWIHTIANQENVEKTIVIAHNFKGYDGYFILEELYNQHVTNLQQIVNGAKILSLELPNVKFIDSMNFFPMALSNFPKTFGIREL